MMTATGDAHKGTVMTTRVYGDDCYPCPFPSPTPCLISLTFDIGLTFSLR